MGLGCSCVQQHHLETPDLTGDCPKFSLEGEVCYGYCHSVVDGDTVKLNLATPFGNRCFSCRLAHLDSPELKSTVPEERRHARACKALVEKMLLHRHCVVQCGKMDKYGRLLVTVHLSLEKGNNKTPKTVTFAEFLTWPLPPFLNLNQFLLDSSPCVPYEGRKKHTFSFRPNYPEVYWECYLARVET